MAEEGSRDRPLDVTLDTLARGAAGELFDLEFRRILASINDPNTLATAKRVITITLTITPDETRTQARAVVDISSKIPQMHPHAMPIFIGERAGSPVAVMFDPRQGTLFSEDSDPSVSPIQRKAGTE